MASGCRRRTPRKPHTWSRRRIGGHGCSDPIIIPAMKSATFLSWAVLLMTSTPSFAAGKEVLAEHGMAATSHKKAVAIGVEILKRGGNAVDAAIAMNAAMGVVEPMSCGAGGDLYAIVWDAKTKKLYGLNASGRSPYKATREYFADKKLKEIPTSGPLSSSVPGCVDGWDELRKRFGRMSFDQLL